MAGRRVVIGVLVDLRVLGSLVLSMEGGCVRSHLVVLVVG